MQKFNNIRQLLALVIILASVSLAVTIMMKLSQEKKSPESLPRSSHNVDVALEKVHYTETKNGVKKWDLVADKAEYDKVKDVSRLTNIRLIVAGSPKTGDITLTADRAEYSSITREVKLQGNIMAKSVSGLGFVTGHATYSADQSRIHTPDRVRFTDGNLSVEGVGMEFMTTTKNLKIFREVTAQVGSGMVGR